MKDLNIILNKQEIKLIQENTLLFKGNETLEQVKSIQLNLTRKMMVSRILIIDRQHDLYVKVFLEQIIPFIKENPGYKQSDLMKRLPDNEDKSFKSKMYEFLYFLSKESLIERIKKQSTYELYLKSDLSLIKDFININRIVWQNKIKGPSTLSVNCKIHPNREQIIINYFGMDIINIFRNYNPKYYLGIGNCLNFEMNDILKQTIGKYWTNECEKELKIYLLKFGFFSDSDFVRFKLVNIIGKKKFNELIEELKHHASDFKISWCGLETSIPSHNILYDFVQSLKFKWGLKPDIVEKRCIYCNEKFIPIYHLRGISGEFESKHLSISSLNEIDFCLFHALGQNKGNYSNKTDISKERMIQLIKDLINVIGYIPSSNFKDDLTYLNNLDKTLFNTAIKILNDMPPNENSFQPTNSYKGVFGSWFKALIAAGVLEDDSQKMKFGYRCLGIDGHVCYSLAEKNIDDWLHLHKIPHEKEPLYPTGYLRADWKVDTFFIEYWGLKGNEDYDKKILIKREILEEYNIPLIEINQGDLLNLEVKLKILQST